MITKAHEDRIKKELRKFQDRLSVPVRAIDRLHAILGIPYDEIAEYCRKLWVRKEKLNDR
ncbi:MAG: hypothetical protein AB1401_00790 [Thermodesulfobacteriota bacterium]